MNTPGGVTSLPRSLNTYCYPAGLRGWLLRACTWPPQGPACSSVGEDRRTPDLAKLDELIAELRDRVRSLETQLRQERAANRENRRIIASLTSRYCAERPERVPAASRAEPPRRRYSSWWKERFVAAMVGVMTAFAVLTANSGENPLRVEGGEQASVPTTPANTEPAPAASEPVPVRPTDPVR
jgi:hypothetical protein